MADEEKATVRVPLIFVGADEAPVHYANQFVVQFYQHEFFLTVGTIVPPMLIGTEEERKAQANQVSYVPVKVLTRIALTRERLAELIRALQDNLAAYDSKQKREQ